ncbi:hypothetical protein LTR66_007580 [Elasticomyces elasticus]|nr:hypothetical protein LTR66_007580 [Elasticomyces elasticus]
MAAAAHEQAAKKKAFFDSLYALENDDDVIDNGLNDSIKSLEGFLNGSRNRLLSRSNERHTRSDPPRETTTPMPSKDVSVVSTTKRRQTGSAIKKGIARTVSAPTVPNSVPQSTKIPDTMAGNPSTRSSPALPATLRHGYTISGVPETANTLAAPPSAIPRSSGKRKRDTEITLMPEDQRIFNGMHFYFFPNNDVHPARRMRIVKALEYGATWQKDWNTRVTHVIVDRGMNYNQVTAFLKLQVLPNNTIMVGEGYPADCIAYRMLVDPKQQRYQVAGYIKPAAPSAVDPAAREVTPSASSFSLQLKQAGRAGTRREPQTPSRTEEVASTPPTLGTVRRAPRSENHAWERTGDLIQQDSDELDAAIRQAKELQHLPLEFYKQDEDSRSSSPAGDEPDNEVEHVSKNAEKSPNPAWQDRFQCMQKHTSSDSLTNPNAATIAVLQEMCDHYAAMRDEWRSTAYRRAIASLCKETTARVVTKEDAQKLPFIGERLAEKIEEIAFTNRLRRLDNARSEPNDHVLQTFLKIYGVGFAQASRWVSQGYRSLEDLLAKANLSENQKVGIAHFDDFNARMPRSEVEEHAAVVREVLHRVDATFQIYIMGSYRRGAESSGDIDLIITRPSTSISQIRTVVIDTVVPKLFKSGFLKATLAATSRANGTTWHGASCLPTAKRWRRIDFLLVPEPELGAAMIYFTGNDIFNRSMRLLASKKGMRLNQRGLYKDVMRGDGRPRSRGERVSEGTLVAGADEKKIFEALGVPWRPPHHRIC